MNDKKEPDMKKICGHWIWCKDPHVKMSLAYLKEHKEGHCVWNSERFELSMRESETWWWSLDFIGSAKESYWIVLGRGVIISDLSFKKSLLSAIGIMDYRG